MKDFLNMGTIPSFDIRVNCLVDMNVDLYDLRHCAALIRFYESDWTPGDEHARVLSYEHERCLIPAPKNKMWVSFRYIVPEDQLVTILYAIELIEVDTKMVCIEMAHM